MNPANRGRNSASRLKNLSKRGKVAEIVDVGSIEIDVRYLASGAGALVSVDAYPGETRTGMVEFVAFKADTATKTFRVRNDKSVVQVVSGLTPGDMVITGGQDSVEEGAKVVVPVLCSLKESLAERKARKRAARLSLVHAGQES